ncbi:hypothetical protein SARC_15599 [Sphaeroforma arctica JP610]|uniref:T-box domain-containing protein n=1 Tax=Sphaeroforma arctica JP610 TaxID=667725 RepID=A0A0L0F5G7_9EUKA|nr:hypothetical protein SARC_15599 [Sphaeroforma arctica JP610]KNC71854.1 hypothetical protein SARC_15599 [Sphaeroforma arctica JP610]|eukprot:XP_014145756.1 hypothetical protein SARC_15599 [Sphaeroforma arctica JP610]
MTVPPLSGANVEVYNHPWITASGKKLMEDPISFDKLRLTNDPKNKTHVLLVPFRKYIPTVYVAPVAVGGGSGEMRMDGDVNFFRIEMAEFISSSAYHNPRMAALKIETNPMAKSQRNLRKNQKLQQQRAQQLIGSGSQLELGSSNSSPASRPHLNLQQQNQYARRSASAINGIMNYNDRNIRLHRSSSTPNSAGDPSQRSRYRSKSPSSLSRQPKSPPYHFQGTDSTSTPQTTPPINSMAPTPMFTPAQVQRYSFPANVLDSSKDSTYRTTQRLDSITDESSAQQMPVTPMKRGDTSTYTAYASGRRSNYAGLTPSNLSFKYKEENDIIPLQIFQ